jgi:hypothetical protein
MPAHRKSRKLIPLAAALCLTVAGAFGGYAIAENHSAAGSRLSDAANVAGVHGSRTVTIYACLAKGSLTHISAATASKCPARSTLVQWNAESGPATTGTAQPTPTASATSSAPGTTSSTPPSTSPAAPPSTSPASGPACTATSNDGSCGPYTYADITGSNGSSTRVIQDIWNPIGGASQKLTAFSPGNWSVSANMPASNTAVVSYPDTQQLYTTEGNTPKPLTSFNSITSSYAETGPATSGDDWEAAYDIWAGTGSSNYAQEIMIWVDNHGQRPAGSVVASATIDGVGYKVWSTGKAGAVGNPVSMVLDSNQASGSVTVLDDLNWLKSNGYMPAGSGLNQVDFGFELCSTGGATQTFSVSQFGIKSS